MIQKVKMEELEDAQPGALLAIDYARGAKVGLPVRVMVELKERRYFKKYKRWDWVGKVVNCSPALKDKYLGAMLRINPTDSVYRSA